MEKFLAHGKVFDLHKVFNLQKVLTYRKFFCPTESFFALQKGFGPINDLRTPNI
jgi:hypothetical protein